MKKSFRAIIFIIIFFTTVPFLKIDAEFGMLWLNRTMAKNDLASKVISRREYEKSMAESIEEAYILSLKGPYHKFLYEAGKSAGGKTARALIVSIQLIPSIIILLFFVKTLRILLVSLIKEFNMWRKDIYYEETDKILSFFE